MISLETKWNCKKCINKIVRGLLSFELFFSAPYQNHPYSQQWTVAPVWMCTLSILVYTSALIKRANRAHTEFETVPLCMYVRKGRHHWLHIDPHSIVWPVSDYTFNPTFNMYGEVDKGRLCTHGFLLCLIGMRADSRTSVFQSCRLYISLGICLW